MAYTSQELVAAYTAAGAAPPDAAMTRTLEALAARTRAGETSEAEALSFVLVRGDVISAVTAEIVGFFNGRPPRRIDVAPVAELVAESARAAVYSAENRLAGFAAEQALGPGRRAFTETYGAMDYPAFVAAAYEQLIGAEAARAAGYDAGAAVADTAGRYDGFLALVKSHGLMGEPLKPQDEPLAAKAATVGYLLCEAIKWDFGVCARRAEAQARALISGEGALRA